MPYIGKTTDGFGVRNRFVYLASASDTSVSGADANGATLTFTDGAYVDVYLNGVLLKPGTDYNTNTANTIAGISSMAANDEVTVIVYDVFTVADMVSATSGGTFSGRVDFTGGIGGSGGNLVLKNTDTADDSFPTLTLQTGDTDIAVGDALGKINFQAPDEGAGTDAITVAASIQAVSEGDFSASNNATSVVIFTGESEAAESDGGGKYTFDSFGQLFLKNTTNADGSTPALRLETGDIDIAQDDMLGRIMFTAPDEGAGTDAIALAAEIRAISEGDFSASNNETSLSFLTGSSGGATEKMRLGSNGFLGIAPSGGVTPGQMLELDRSSESSADVAIYFNGNGVDWTLGTDADDSGFLKFSNNATVGTSTSMYFGASNRVNMSSTSTAGRLNLGFSHSTGMVGIDIIPDGTTATMLQFKNSGGVVRGSITTGGSDTSYNETSDYRLKENVNYSWDATSKLKQLKPAKFNWIDDETDTLIGGFLAHEVSSVVPEAVTGKKDETRDIGNVKDKDGNIIDKDVIEAQAKKDEGQTWTKTGTENVYQQIDKSKLVPLLVKTIQELEARVTALESK